jgi:hypothetical protein
MSRSRFALGALVLGVSFAVCSSANAQESSHPLTAGEGHVSIALPLKLSPGGGIEQLEQGNMAAMTGTIWLHSWGKSTCYFEYDEIYYEAKTTASKDLNSPPVNVDKLDLYFSIAGDSGSNTCNSTYICTKTIKDYNMYCRTPRCVSARATYHGQSWSTNRVCW